MVNKELPPLLPPAPQDDLLGRYFLKIKGVYLYKLKEVTYDEENRPVSISHGKDNWSQKEATAFSNLCGGWILSAEEKVKGGR